VVFVAAALPAPAQNSPVLDILSQELNRNFSALKQKAEPAAYFLSYEVTEQDYRGISGTLGTLEYANNSKNRGLDVSVRVGSPQLDNYRKVIGERTQFTTGAQLSFEDNANG
jgi:TldD protein